MIFYVIIGLEVRILEATKNLKNKDDNNKEDISQLNYKRKIIILDKLENEND